MSVVTWSTPRTRSSNLAGTTFNSLANGSAGTAITYDNSTNRDLYAIVTVKLGSLDPTTGGSITLRVYSGDGTDTPDIATGANVGGGEFDSYSAALTDNASAKTVIFKMVRLYPFSNIIFQIVNNAGVSTAASGNEFYMRTFNEDVS
jgi:hypothetical protein